MKALKTITTPTPTTTKIGTSFPGRRKKGSRAPPIHLTFIPNLPKHRAAYQYHRDHDEVVRDILSYLLVNGTSSITYIEYGVEINVHVTKQTLRDLTTHGLIGILSHADLNKPENKHLLPRKMVRLSKTVIRFYYITEQGKKCLKVMDELSSFISSSRLRPKRI